MTERNQSSSLRRALALLSHVRAHAGAGRGVSLTQLADDLGMSKSTVLRLATPLVEDRLLARDRESGWFRLGPGALLLGQAYLSTLDLRAVAGAESHRLMREARETVHLVVYEPPHVVYVDKVESQSSVRLASRIGSWAPAHCTAAGKAILAWLPDDALDTVFAADLSPRTDQTITDPEALRAELVRIRRRGYAVDDRENEAEVRCVAAPIFDHTNAVTAALSVSGLSTRIPTARVRSLGPSVAQAGARVSRALGSTR